MRTVAFSFLIAILSIVVFRERVIDLTTTTFNSVLETLKTYDDNSRSSSSAVTNSDTVTKSTTAESESEAPFYNPSEKLVVTEMSVPRAIRKVFLAVEQAEGAGARVRSVRPENGYAPNT